MLILPFTHEVIKQNAFNIHIVKLLTIGGKDMWDEPSNLNIDNDILIPNDIYRKGNIIKFKNNIQLCEIDTNKTNINDFYKWSEIDINDTETFCWRVFYNFIDDNNQVWLNIPDNEKISNYKLNEIVKMIIKNS